MIIVQIKNAVIYPSAVGKCKEFITIIFKKIFL